MSEMSRDRAIEILRDDANHATLWEIAKAVDMAIEALKEQMICPIFSDDNVKQPCIKSPCGFERPHGEWITEPHSRIIHCSNCGAEENRNKLYLAKWCYSCGADMRKEGESE